MIAVKKPSKAKMCGKSLTVETVEDRNRLDCKPLQDRAASVFNALDRLRLCHIASLETSNFILNSERLFLLVDR